MVNKIILTESQRRQLEELWFVFGNHGPKHSMENHKTIQALLETGKDCRDFYEPTRECLEAVDKIICQN